MSMCKNHPGMVAIGRCAGCAEEFCQNCLVEIHGQKYCGACKVIALQGKVPEAVVAAGGTQLCPQAKEALIMAIVGLIGLFCLYIGIVLEVMAITRAQQAKKAIAADPRLSGAGMANAAMIIAIITLVLCVFGLIARVSSLGH